MATDIWKYSRVYDLGRYYVDLCTRTQFSKVIIRGRERIPSDGAVIYAPNHVAAMMDPLVALLVNGHSPVGFGARSDLFAGKAASRALHFVRILPLARERNGLKEVARNLDTFDDITSCLEHGIPFCMYAEGTHRAEKGLLPLKKGVFRIARSACEKLGKPVYVVPVSSDYEDFFRPMGRISITVGEPIDVGKFFRDNEGESDAALYRSLLERLSSQIKGNLYSLPPGRHIGGLGKAACSIILFPIWLPCAVLSSPIWLVSELIIGTMEDKAFSQTVYFALRFLFPVLWPFYWIFAWYLRFLRR